MDSHRDELTVNNVTYREIYKIGEGTYGAVHLVTPTTVNVADPSSVEFFAVKNIRINRGAEIDNTSIDMAATERRLQMLVKHENVVRIFDASMDDTLGLYRIRMEIIEYELHKVIVARQYTVNFSDREVRGYMKQILTGVAHCHRFNVLHCDLNSKNILISSTGIVKIADFGFARIIEKEAYLADTGVNLWFRPPELLLYDIQNPQNRRTVLFSKGVDIWSAGCVMAEMMLCRSVFTGIYESAVLVSIVKLLGTPDEANFKLMNWNIDYCRRVPNLPSKLYESPLFQDWIADPKSTETMFLLSELLNVNVSRRPTALEVLNRNCLRCQCEREIESGENCVVTEAPFTRAEIASSLYACSTSKVAIEMEKLKTIVLADSRLHERADEGRPPTKRAKKVA